MKIEIKYKDVYIQDVKVGDYVKSFDIENDRVRHNRVGNTILPIVEKYRQCKVVCENGASVVTSTTHPICYYNKDNNKWEYKNTGDLVIGDLVKPEFDIQTKVTELLIGLDEDEQFYDLTVERDNNYFAGDDKDNMIVVHNSATIYFPWWHYEIEDILVLKNNKGTDDNRVRHMDYGIQFSRLFYQRFKNDENVSLFSPSVSKELYEYFGNNEKFDKLYLELEANKKIHRKTIKARALMDLFIRERSGTGRLYVMNIDNANSNNPFKEQITMSNLCTEITLPVKELNSIYDIDSNDETVDKSDGEIALCVLGAFNLGNIKSKDELMNSAKYLVRLLDFIIEHQDYPINASKKMLKRRSMGIGVTNLAYWMAKNDILYTDESPETLSKIDELFDDIQFAVLTASNELAKELGPCKWFNKTTYSEGIMPLDRYNKNLDKYFTRTSTNDWNSLRESIKEHGLRNSVLTAIMPAESSAVVQNATNGIEPIRSLVTSKRSKGGVIKTVAPESIKLKNKYQLAYDMKSNRGYIIKAAIIQKWIDQAISLNTYYEYSSDGISLKELIQDQLLAYSLGLKTMYYANTNDKKGEVNLEDVGCAGGACTL